MFPKGANMSKLLKQAQKMKQDMEDAQNSLLDMRIDYKSSDEMVHVVMNGKKTIISLSLSQELLNEEKDIIEDVLISVFNKANLEVDSKVEEKMSSVTGGMMPNIPGF